MSSKRSKNETLSVHLRERFRNHFGEKLRHPKQVFVFVIGNEEFELGQDQADVLARFLENLSGSKV